MKLLSSGGLTPMRKHHGGKRYNPLGHFQRGGMESRPDHHGIRDPFQTGICTMTDSVRSQMQLDQLDSVIHWALLSAQIRTPSIRGWHGYAGASVPREGGR